MLQNRSSGQKQSDNERGERLRLAVPLGMVFIGRLNQRGSFQVRTHQTDKIFRQFHGWHRALFVAHHV